MTDVNVPGAQVGDVLLSSFVGPISLPSALMVEPLKVIAVNTVRYKICDPTTNPTSAVSGVGIRVLSFP